MVKLCFVNYQAKSKLIKITNDHRQHFNLAMSQCPQGRLLTIITCIYIKTLIWENVPTFVK